MWATEYETRAKVVDHYRRRWEHLDVTVDSLPVECPGRVPWWHAEVERAARAADQPGT